MPIDFFMAPKKSIWISFLSLIFFGGAFMDFYNNLNAFISSVRQRFSSKEFCETYRNSENSFTRNRKLSFPAIFSFLLSCPNHTLASDLDTFMTLAFPHKAVSVSKQAFSASRRHISDAAFQEIFRFSRSLASMNSNPKLWHGHCVKAIDGTTFRLPNTPENRKEFLAQKNQNAEYAMAKSSVLFDLSHDIIEDAILSHCHESEKNQALTLLNHEISTPGSRKRSIILFDRGYPSRELLRELWHHNYLFLMRCSSSFLKKVNEAGEGDTIITYFYKKELFHLRVIKFLLPTGEMEVLITNIMEPYSVEEFKDLYHWRWGIEGKYRELKQQIKLENFSGKKPIMIRQDFYASLFMANLIAVFKSQSDCFIQKSTQGKRLKYEYQTNRNFLTGLLVGNYQLFMEKEDWLLQKITQIINKAQKERSPIRPGRSIERSFRMPSKISLYPSSLRCTI